MPDLHFGHKLHCIASILRNNSTAEYDVRTTEDRFEWSARIETRTPDCKIVGIHVVILRSFLVADIPNLFIFIISSCSQEKRLFGKSIGTQDHDNLRFFERSDDALQPVRTRLAVPVGEDEDTAARLTHRRISGREAPPLEFLNQSNTTKLPCNFDGAIRRTIVGEKDFIVFGRIILIDQGSEAPRDCVFLVVTRDNHRNGHTRG